MLDCKKCKFCKENCRAFISAGPQCTHEKGVINLETSEFMLCNTMRKDEGLCGIKGKLFVKKEDLPL